MSQKDFEIRFDAARARLNNSLKELEKTVTEKLYLSSSNHRNTNEDEQSALIKNLNNELNKLQKTLVEIGSVNKNLTEENQKLLNDLNKFDSYSSFLVEEVESDLTRIEEIIKGEK